MLLTTVIRQINMLGPLVMRILFPINQAFFLQHIHRARHDSLVEIQHRCQFILARALMVKDTQQHDILGIRQIQPGTGFDNKDLRTPVQDREPAPDIDIFIHDKFLPSRNACLSIP